MGEFGVLEPDELLLPGGVVSESLPLATADSCTGVGFGGALGEVEDCGELLPEPNCR